MHSAHTVLVVDDEPAIREMLEDVLSSEGCRVITAPDGVAALDRLREGSSRPCVILLDMLMPRMNGWQFARELRADNKLSEIPFALIGANPSFAADAESLGADRWLGKPLHLEQLLSTVDELCATA
jgi:CheY-like chemotaxis protein